jgi:hypothetical protein
MNLICGLVKSVTQQVFPVGIIPFSSAPNSLGFNLDRDSIMRIQNNKNLKFRVYFAKPLQV